MHRRNEQDSSHKYNRPTKRRSSPGPLEEVAWHNHRLRQKINFDRFSTLVNWPTVACGVESERNQREEGRRENGLNEHLLM